MPFGRFDDPPSGGAGDDAVELAAVAGLHLDEYQANALRWSLAEDRRGHLVSSSTTGVVGRQNGKGAYAESRQLAKLTLFADGGLQIHSAHLAETAISHFRRIVDLIEGCDDIARRVAKIRLGAGEQAIEMLNGNRLTFKTRSNSGGRGLTCPDLYLDEAMFLTPEIMRALFSTGAAKSMDGLRHISYLGSAPYVENEWWHAHISMMRKSPPSNAVYWDFGVEPPSSSLTDDELAAWASDRDRWYASNPALGVRISEDFLEEELATLGTEGFLVERLGVVRTAESANLSGVDLAAYDARVGSFELSAGGPVVVDIDETGSRGAIAAAGVVDGRRCVEITAAGGLVVLTDWLARQAPGAFGRIGFDASSNSRLIVGLLRAIDRHDLADMCHAVTGAEVQASEVGFAQDPPVHRGDGRLRSAILAAVQRPVGDRWSWSRRKSTDDITPLVAAAIAVELSAVPAAGGFCLL